VMARSRVFDLMRMPVLEFACQALALRSGDMWLVPDAAAAQRLAGRHVFRARIWTAVELVDIARPQRIIAALIASIWMIEEDDIVAEPV
jgi:hypothetical protein